MLLVGVGASLFLTPASGESGRSLQSDFPKLDLSRSAIKLREIESGGVPRDGIAAILVPSFLPAREISDLASTEPVISLEGDCGAVAFPYRVLIWHEIVHHNHCGTPVAVTFCPLCNASMVFDRRVDGETLSFGTTGRLRKSDLIMYDHQTESFWQQFTGEAIVGDWTGKQLTALPARIESFEKFNEVNPEGKVLVPPKWGRNKYGRNPYDGYDSMRTPLLYKGRMPRGIAPLARVVRVGDRAWSLKLVRKKGPIETTDGLRIEWSPGQNSMLDRSKIAKGRDIGNVRVTRDGANVAYSVDFAFAFRAFYPEGTLVK
ncbi:MAG: DUF3179 domain-containing protein [Novosphingobium sp.]|nr:DUF3179 domain-containing protein [Novosphingobium sp.]